MSKFAIIIVSATVFFLTEASFLPMVGSSCNCPAPRACPQAPVCAPPAPAPVVSCGGCGGGGGGGCGGGGGGGYSGGCGGGGGGGCGGGSGCGGGGGGGGGCGNSGSGCGGGGGGGGGGGQSYNVPQQSYNAAIQAQPQVPQPVYTPNLQQAYSPPAQPIAPQVQPQQPYSPPAAPQVQPQQPYSPPAQPSVPQQPANYQQAYSPPEQPIAPPVQSASYQQTAVQPAAYEAGHAAAAGEQLQQVEEDLSQVQHQDATILDAPSVTQTTVVDVKTLELTNDTDCNSQELRQLILENMDEDLNSSKRLIQLAAETRFGGRFDVICSNHDFSYITNTELYCQETRDNISCYAYRQL